MIQLSADKGRQTCTQILKINKKINAVNWHRRSKSAGMTGWRV